MSEKTTIILCIGDSIVNGYPYPRTFSWPALLQGLLLESGERVKVVNKGLNGESSAELLEHFASELALFRPDLVLIASGTNDFIFTEATPGQVFANLKEMYHLTADHGAVPVAIASVLTVPEMASRCWTDGTDYLRVNRYLQDLRRLISQSGQVDGLAWIDLQTGYSCLLQQLGADFCYADGLHPTKAGYEAIAAIVREWLVNRSL